MQTLSGAVAKFTGLNGTSSDAEKEAALEIVLGSIDGSVTFLDLVKELGSSLQSNDQLIREQGMLLFSTVIDRLPSYSFDEQAVKVMVAFLVERSADYICEAECIYGLWALFTHHEELTATHLHVIFRTLFKITISSQLRKTRLETYVIIKESLQRHFDQVETFDQNSTSSQFIRGFLNMFEGEKDPRNLLVCLQCLELMVTKFSATKLDVLSEEIFQGVACYYPISFTPPKGSTITPDDLMVVQRRILTINPSIAARFFPFLCDKLAEQNQSPGDRLEVFKTLQAIYRRHWTRELGAVLPELWQGIRAATWYGQDSEPIYEEANNLLKTWMKAKFPESMAFTKFDTIYSNSILKTIMEEIQMEMRVPDSRLAREAAKTLVNLASTSTHVFQICVDVQWEALEKALRNVKTPEASKLAWLTMLSSLFSLPFDDMHPIKPWVEQLFELLTFSASANDESLQKVAINSLTTLAVKNLVSTDQMQDVSFLFSSLLETTENASVRSECTDSLIRIAKVQPKLVNEYYIHPSLAKHPFMQVFKESRRLLEVSAPNLDAVAGLYFETEDLCFENVQQKHPEGALSIWRDVKLWLAGIPQSDTRVMHLSYEGKEPWECATSWQVGTIEQSEVDPTITVKLLSMEEINFPFLSLQILLTVASADTKSFHEVLQELTPNVLRVLQLATVSGPCPLQKLVNDLIENLSSSFSTIDKSTSDLDSWVETFLFLILDCLLSVEAPTRLAELSKIITASLRMSASFPRTEELIDIVVKADISRVCKSTLLTAIASGLRVGALTPRFCEFLCSNLVNESATHGELPTLQALACITNHVGSDELEETIIDTQLKEFKMGASVLATKIWLFKSRLMRYSSQFVDILNQIVALLMDPDDSIAMQMAEGIQTIVSDHSCISPAPFGQTKVFFRQRFFHQILPLLLKNVPDLTQPATSILITVATITGSVPSTVVQPHLETIFPLILRSFLRNESSLQRSSLQGLLQILKETPKLLTPHIQSIYPILLSISQDMSSIELRCTALMVLGELTTLPDKHVLARHRRQILRSLRKILNDPRRRVREKASDCSEAWHLKEL